MLKRSLFLVFATICLALCFILFPSFIYNELEFKFRNEFLSAVVSLDSADYGVRLRQDYVTDDHQELVDVGNLIEKNIGEAIVHIDKAQSYNKKQNIVVNFLSPKYKIYHEKKVDAVSGYEIIANEYLERKRKEHLSSNTLSLVFQTQQKIRSMENEEDWWRTINDLPQIVQTIRSNSEELYEGSVIDDGAYNYYQSEAEGFMFMYDQSQNVLTAQSWDVFDSEGLVNLNSEEIDVDQIFSDTRLQWEKQISLKQEEVEKNNDMLYEVSDYYNENKLVYDKISVILSFVNDSFPRMKYVEGEFSSPTIIPHSTNPELLSLLSNN